MILSIRRPRKGLSDKVQWCLIFTFVCFVAVEVAMHQHRMPVLLRTTLDKHVGERNMMQVNDVPIVTVVPLRMVTEKSKELEACTRKVIQRNFDIMNCEAKPCKFLQQNPAELRVDIITHPLIQACNHIKMTLFGGVVYLQFIDETNIEAAKNWICNVLVYKSILPRTIFVANDDVSYDALTSFLRTQLSPVMTSSIHIQLVKYTPFDHSKQELVFGTRAYYDMMLFRTDIVYQLLVHDIDIFVLTVDSMWHTDPSTLMFAPEGDLITIHNHLEPTRKRRVVSPGFTLWRTRNPRMLEFMEALLTKQQEIINAEHFDIANIGDGQVQMTNLLRTEFADLRVTFLPHDLFFHSGKFDQETPLNRTPYVRLNNDNGIGHDERKARAMSAGYWFLDGSGTSCIVAR